MARNRNETIDKITFTATGTSEDTQTLFNSFKGNEGELFRLRHRIEKGIQSGQWECVCYHCQRGIKLIFSGEDSGVQYFQHIRNSGFCRKKKYKSRPERLLKARQYNGKQEGRQHKEIKELLADFLRKDKSVIEVRVESIYRNPSSPRNWRKPDVFALFVDQKLVIEVQRSNTLVSTIVGREDFYGKNGIHVLWVLPSFTLDKKAQTALEKDILYNHRHNVFVLDEKAKRISKEIGELLLTCFYERFSIENGELKTRWEEKFVTLKDLVFDTDFRVFFFDSLAEKEDILKNLE